MHKESKWLPPKHKISETCKTMVCDQTNQPRHQEKMRKILIELAKVAILEGCYTKENCISIKVDKSTV